MKIRPNQHPSNPSLSMAIYSIDELLRRLSKQRDRFPARARFITARIDSTLDERLRLMRIRDALRAGSFSSNQPTKP